MTKQLLFYFHTHTHSIGRRNGAIKPFVQGHHFIGLAFFISSYTYASSKRLYTRSIDWQNGAIKSFVQMISIKRFNILHKQLHQGFIEGVIHVYITLPIYSYTWHTS